MMTLSNTSTRIGILCLALALAACSREGGPAPLTMGSAGESDLGDTGPGGVPGYKPGGPVLRQTGGGSVVVSKGQTLYAVARAQNVPVRSLIDANHLQPPYHVQAGDKLIVPRIREHVVQPGETLYAVSRRYGVEATTLAQANHLQPPYNIRVGTPLVLPPSVAAPTAVASASPSYGAPVPLANSPGGGTPLAPPTALSQAGKPLALNAVKPGTLTPPKALPGTPAANAAPGAPIPLTPPGTPAAQAPTEETAEAAPPATPGQLTPPPAGAKAAAPQTPAEPEEQPAGAAAPATPTAAVTVASIVTNHRAPSAPIFYWPVRGKIISVFGPASGGMHNDGVNIVAPEGTTVSAAENGVVAYAGNELKGFGNLLLIKHSGGWISAYAHSKVLLVKKGDHVRRGQPIAQIGATGGVSQPQLHFELRQGAKAIDPLDHLPALSGNG